MAHRTYPEIGTQILRGNWGHDDGGDFRNFIKNLSSENRSACLLALIADELATTRRWMLTSMESLEEEVKSLSSPECGDHSSDGMLSAFKLLDGDLEWRRFGDELSSRARRILSYRSIKYMSEITLERLVDIRGCGDKTTEELMEFKRIHSE